MRTGVYTIVNTVNDKMYVGSAVNYAKRIANHKYELGSARHANVHLQRAWNKHGRAAFEFVLLLHCAPEHLVMFEQRAMNTLKPEYNICPTAGSSLGRPHIPMSADVRNRISATLKGRPKSAETRAKMAGRKNSLGCVPSEETRRKLSQALQKVARGESNGNATFRDAEIASLKAIYRTIRPQHATSVSAIRQIADAYSRRIGTIKGIVSGQNWRHVQ